MQGYIEIYREDRRRIKLLIEVDEYENKVN